MADDLEQTFTVREVAAAYHVSEETIRRWIKRGDIKYVAVGPFRLKRIRPGDIAQEVRHGEAKQKQANNSTVPTRGNGTGQSTSGGKTEGTGSDPINS
jgi:excisionase family DNA binding protein